MPSLWSAGTVGSTEVVAKRHSWLAAAASGDSSARQLGRVHVS